MGSVAQAVLEFDEAVQVPWRPPLASVPAVAAVRSGAAGPPGRPHAVRAARLAGLPAEPTARGVVPAGATRPRGAACARCDSSGACTPGVLRLTRRARRLLAVLVAGVGVAAAAWFGAVLEEGAGLRLAGGASTVVQPGDTLWSIARSVAGDSDVRGVVDEIQRLNDLEGTVLVPGQVLELP